MNDKVCEERGYHDWKVSEDFGTMADDSQYAILICKDCEATAEVNIPNNDIKEKEE